MANTNNPRGLVPSPAKGGDTIPVMYYRCNTSADLYKGMPVQLGADGRVIAGSANGSVQYLGVITGFVDGNKAALPTNDPFLDVSDLGSDLEPWAAVTSDPNQEFIIQGDTGGTLATIAEVGAGFDLVYRGPTASAVTGNANTGWATLEVDSSSGAATTDKTVVFLGFQDITNEDGTQNASGNFAKMRVRILHQQGAYGTAVGSPVI